MGREPLDAWRGRCLSGFTKEEKKGDTTWTQRLHYQNYKALKKEKKNSAYKKSMKQQMRDMIGCEQKKMHSASSRLATSRVDPMKEEAGH